MTAQIDWLNATSAWAQQIAENPFTSVDTLRVLGIHSDIRVRTAVADRKDTPLETIMILGQDESADLRYAIAENHNVHLDVLNMLSEDSNPFVAHRARKTIERVRVGAGVLRTLRDGELRQFRLGLNQLPA